MNITRPILLYDDACAPCRRFAALAHALNVGGRVEFASLDSARAEALLPEMSRWDRLQALRFLTPEGGHFTADGAVSELFARLPATGWIWNPVRRAIPFARRAMSWLYGRAAQSRACGTDHP